MELPVSFRRAPELLLKGMDAEGPDAVICLGLAANRKKISLEKVGLNYAYARIPTTTVCSPGHSSRPIRACRLLFHLAGLGSGRRIEPGRNSS